MWYDKDGKKLLTAKKVGSKLWNDQMREVEKLLTNKNYKIVKQEKLWWGGWLSTVWLGLDYNLSYVSLKDKKHKPLIFETMLFLGSRSDIDMNRYYTEKEARAGHRAMKDHYNDPKMIFKAYLSCLEHWWSMRKYRRSSPLSVTNTKEGEKTK